MPLEIHIKGTKSKRCAYNYKNRIGIMYFVFFRVECGLIGIVLSQLMEILKKYLLSFNDCILLQMILIVILIDAQWNIDINAL